MPDELLPVDILVGRDALSLFGLSLRFETSCITNKIPNSEIHRPFNNRVEQINTSLKLNDCVVEHSPLRCLASLIPTSDFVSMETPMLNVNLWNKLDERPSAKHTTSLAEPTADDDTLDFLHSFALPSDEIDDLKPIDNYFYDSMPSVPTSVSIESFDINPVLNRDAIEAVRSCVLLNYIDVDPAEVQPIPYKLHIRLEHDTPFTFRPRRLSFSEKADVRKIVQSLLEDGIIRSSDSPYSSPIVLVKKKNGDTRMCVDYRTLNSLTIRDNFPLLLIEDCLEYLLGKNYFTLLDLKSGFHQVPVDDNSVKYTSFVTPV